MSDGILSNSGRYLNRRSIRLKNYDYSGSGAYFITICVHNRENLFGKIENNKTILNDAGQIAFNEWIKTPEMRPNIQLDAFVIMPNHVHGILIINDSCRGTMHRAPTTTHRAPTTTANFNTNINNAHGTHNHARQIEQFGKPTSNTIPTIIRGYKSSVTKQINIIRTTPGIPVWQRNYYEHVIHDTKGLNRIKEYIVKNPLSWDTDKYNLSKYGNI